MDAVTEILLDRTREADRLTRMMILSLAAHAAFITIITFGFKYSLPYNLDLLFDVRFLPNPHFVEALRPKTGLDPEVIEYLRHQEGYEEFYRKLLDFVTYVLPGYRKEMKSYLTIGIGCTGGKHRSVAIGQRLSDDLAAAGYAIETVHRDCRR